MAISDRCCADHTELRELTYPSAGMGVPKHTDDRDGSRIYRRSLTFLLVVATTSCSPRQS